jgi:hypothetical protein
MVTIRNPDGSFEKARVFVRVSALVVGLDFATKVVAAAAWKALGGSDHVRRAPSPNRDYTAPFAGGVAGTKGRYN